MKKILSAALACIMLVSALTMSVLATTQTDSHHQKDYESFEEFWAALSSEQKEIFLADEETLEELQESTNWAKKETRDASSDDGYNPSTLPMAAYPSGSYFTYNGSACTCHEGADCRYDYSTGTRCYDPDTGAAGNCKRYKNSIQCVAFGKYVYDCYTGKDINSIAAEYMGESVSTSSKWKTFASNLSVGSYVRSMGHTFIVAGIDSTGITIYDCNGQSDYPCRVRVVHKTWSNLASYYTSITLVYNP